MLENLRAAWRSLSANKLRSFLTMLGVIIGVGAVVCLISLGQGAGAMITSQIRALGSNLIMIASAGRPPLLAEDAEDLVERMPELVRAMPMVSRTVTVKWGRETWETTVQGVTPDLPAIRDFYPLVGRFVQQTDIQARRRVAVVGQTVVDELFGGKLPLGETILLQGQAFTVVGIMERKGEAMGTDQDDVIFIPLTTAQRLLGTKRVNLIYAQVSDDADPSAVVQRITAIFAAKHRRSDTVRVFSQEQLLQTVAEATRTLTIMLAGIAAVSLLVGGIGIMNIMLVSITERTREIGIRKAVGARRNQLLQQFLVESSLLSVMGGVIGIAAGWAGSRVVAQIGGWPTALSVQAAALAFGFAVLVGIFFGVYPAWKAANLDPIRALRYE